MSEPVRPVDPGSNDEQLWEAGLPIMMIEVRVTACSCDDPLCPVRARVVEYSGSPDSGAVSVSAQYADDLPPGLALAAWDAVNGAAAHARTEFAQAAIRARLAAGFGGR